MGMPLFVAELRARLGHDLLLLPAVNGLVLNDRGDILLQRRADTGHWSLLGGIVEPGEQPSDAVVREVFEETAVRVVPSRLVGVYLTPQVRYPNGDLAQYVVTAFECVPQDGDVPRVNDDESLDVDYFPLGALPDLSRGHLERIEHAMEQQGSAYFRASGR
jgi:8-oxo-dGTP pyrophosphatase MutT (NUDIX family)